MNAKREVTHEFTTGATLADGATFSDTIELDPSFPWVESVMTQVVKNSSNAPFKLGLKVGNSHIVDDNNINNWVASTAVGHGLREKRLLFNQKGKIITLTGELDAAISSAAITVELTFVCYEKDPREVAKAIANGEEVC